MTAVVGLRVEDTQTASVAYQISCEHHTHNEVQFNHASNWNVYALQTEEEMPNGAEATPLELIDSTNLTFANLFDYRVSRNVVPHLAAVEATSSDKIRFANMHTFSMTRLAFDNSIVDRTRNVAVRTHDFAALLLDDTVKPAAFSDAKSFRGACIPPAARWGGQLQQHCGPDGGWAWPSLFHGRGFTPCAALG
jgi:hypothetical protein